MSDFYKARLAATYTAEGRDEVMLIRHNHLLAEPPTLEWSLQTASYEYIAHTWAGDLPTGNARLTLAAQPLVRANTRASLERKLRHLELQLNLHRTGTLLLEEAYSNGAPTLHTYWTAVIETANASPLPLEEAPPIPGAWGKLDLSIILTNPSEDNPLSRRIEEEPDASQEEESSTEEVEEITQEPQYATGWINMNTPGGQSATDDIYINGVRVQFDGHAMGMVHDWAESVNAANCGVYAWEDPDNSYSLLLRALVPGAAGEQITLVAQGRTVSGPTLTLPSAPNPGIPRT